MNTAVWAKLRYCPYWPARIVEPPQNLKQPKRKFCVYFYGSKNYGFVEIGSTLSYLEHKQKYTKKGRGKKFDLAVSECDEHIKNPTSFEHGHQSQVMVAKELGFVVKIEPDDDGEWYVNEAVNTCSNCSEKQDVIDQIKDELESKTQKVFELESAMKRMQDIHKIEIQELKHKLDESSQKDDETNEFYEVERLVDHKRVGAKQMFLVKWKGYDDSHNNWVERKNLDCKNLLQMYLKTKKFD